MRTSAPERPSPSHTREGPGVNPQPPALGIALPRGGAPPRRPAPVGRAPGPDVCRYLDSEPPHGAHGDARDGAEVVGRHDGALLGAAHARHALSIPKQRGEQRERPRGVVRGGRGARGAGAPHLAPVPLRGRRGRRHLRLLLTLLQLLACLHHLAGVDPALGAVPATTGTSPSARGCMAASFQPPAVLCVQDQDGGGGGGGGVAAAGVNLNP